MNEESKVIATLLTCVFVFFQFFIISATSQAFESQNGENEFKEFCAECHVDGGNIVKPTKTLLKIDREKNGITTAEDIIKIMRKPGVGMTTFDEKTIPDAEARKIAKYIINTFK